LLRAIRPDKLGPAFEEFVRVSIGEFYLSPPPFDLQQVFNDSTATTPLIFILSPGTDPYATLTNFGAVNSISLG
jgi:dynein heavy chain